MSSVLPFFPQKVLPSKGHMSWYAIPRGPSLAAFQSPADIQIASDDACAAWQRWVADEFGGSFHAANKEVKRFPHARLANPNSTMAEQRPRGNGLRQKKRSNANARLGTCWQSIPVGLRQHTTPSRYAVSIRGPLRSRIQDQARCFGPCLHLRPVAENPFSGAPRRIRSVYVL